MNGPKSKLPLQVLLVIALAALLTLPAAAQNAPPARPVLGPTLPGPIPPALPRPPQPIASPAAEPAAPVPPEPQSMRVRDVAHMGGTNSNPLIGYGLVVGLQGTGDSPGSVSQEMLARMMGNLGMAIPKATGNLKAINTKNVAVVMVSADLPPYARPGDTMDVTASSLGDASSIDGGVLMMSLLRAADGQIYASAQGQIHAAPPQTASLTGPPPKAHTNVGTVARGGLCSRDVPMTAVHLDSLQWVLNRPDFEMAARVAAAVNARFGAGSATARDAATVDVSLSASSTGGTPVDLVAQMGGLLLDAGPMVARVMIDARSGAIVTGGNLRLARGEANYRNWKVEVQDAPSVTVEEVVANLQRLGVTPHDEMAVLQALRRSSVLAAEVEMK